MSGGPSTVSHPDPQPDRLGGIDYVGPWHLSGRRRHTGSGGQTAPAVKLDEYATSDLSAKKIDDLVLALQSDPRVGVVRL